MAYKVRTWVNDTVELEDKPFASGAEGELYKIIAPAKYRALCAKLYKDCIKPNPKDPKNQEKIAFRRSKIEFMIKFKPEKLEENTWMICWPVEMLKTTNGQFAGFLMPLAFSNSIELFELTMLNLTRETAAIWKKHNRNEWLKFDRSNGDGIKRRLQLIANIAIAIHNIHSTKKYVLVDLKPQNILVCPKGKISVLDTDSIQISDNGNVLFRSRMVTEEYVPPEQINPLKNIVPLSWDRFILSIIFYEVLFGLHPFAVSCHPPYDNCDTIRDKIKNGLFPFGSKSNYMRAVPPQHQFLRHCPEAVQKLFIKTFDEGITDPTSRPTAEDWGRTVYYEVRRFVPKQVPPARPVTTPLIHKTPEKIIVDYRYLEKKARRSLTFSILVAILFNLIVGLGAIVQSVKAHNLYKKGEYTRCEKAIARSLIWRWIAFVLGLITFVFMIYDF